MRSSGRPRRTLDRGACRRASEGGARRRRKGATGAPAWPLPHTRLDIPGARPMKALCWHGKEDIRYETVPDPEIEHPRDAIIKMSCCAYCEQCPRGNGSVCERSNRNKAHGDQTLGYT